MPAAAASSPQSQPRAHGAHAGRSSSGWASGWHSSSERSLDGDSEQQLPNAHADGPFRDSSTVRSMDEVLSSVMQGRSSWAGGDSDRSASLQVDRDQSPCKPGHGVQHEHATPVDSPAASEGYTKAGNRAGPFPVKPVSSDQSFMSPLASSDTSMRADSAGATPADLSADVDSILCGSFWRS